MNVWLFTSIIVAIFVILVFFFIFIAKIRKSRITKQRNHLAIKVRFNKKNRSSNGSPY